MLAANNKKTIQLWTAQLYTEKKGLLIFTFPNISVFFNNNNNKKRNDNNIYVFQGGEFNALKTQDFVRSPKILLVFN